MFGFGSVWGLGLVFFFNISTLLCVVKANCELEIFMERESLQSLTETHLLMNKLFKHFSLLSYRGQSDTDSLHELG